MTQQMFILTRNGQYIYVYGLTGNSPGLGHTHLADKATRWATRQDAETVLARLRVSPGVDPFRAEELSIEQVAA